MRLPRIAAHVLTETFGERELAAFDALARALHGYVARAGNLERKVDLEAFRREREAENPRKRQERALDRQAQIRAARKAVKAEQEEALGEVEVAVDRIVAKAREPFERKLKHLKYEDDMIWHEYGGLEHPGKAAGRLRAGDGAGGGGGVKAGV